MLSQIHPALLVTFALTALLIVTGLLLFRRAERARRLSLQAPRAPDQLPAADSALASAPAQGAPLQKTPPQDTPLQDTQWQVGLARTQVGLVGRLWGLLKGKAISAETLAEIEEILLTSDVGIKTTEKLVATLKEALSRQTLQDERAVLAALEALIRTTLVQTSPPWRAPEGRPLVILISGVNGVGKTTTIGKLAAHFGAQGQRVLVAAGDTFRAAATDQLQVWATRSGADYYAGEAGQDPASVVFRACEEGVKSGVDVILADTAGRLHTKTNLMEELKKVKRVIGKVIPGAPHETFLVVDATTGQNALLQAREFHQSIGLTGLVLTKLDGTAKGGIVVAISSELGLPVRFIGIGEKAQDLRPFDPEQFVEALFGQNRDSGI